MLKKAKGYHGNQKEGIFWYPSGWTYYKKADKWEAPNYKRQEPTFEEWKAQREKEKQEQK